MSDPFYLTVAIDYSNGDPHFGHAYEKVTADAVARYQRLRGRDVAFVAGTDEHSTNVAKAAREAGLPPKAYADKMAAVFRDTFDRLGVSYTSFMQTSDPRHEQAVQRLVQRIHDNGHVYRATYRGLYCHSCEAFLTEKDLVNGLCPWHERPVEEVEEPNWFFRLSSFTEKLQAHMAAHPSFIEPESRRHEIERLLADGLEDVSISRANQVWGVQLPWDPEHVVYVWFDALITYLSGIGYGWDDATFQRYWPAQVHFIGKDITRFHCVIWPAMLLAAGLPLPEQVFAHGFWYCNGQRFSKSLGNVIDPRDLVERYGVDAARYYLVAESPFGPDGNFTDDSILKRTNSDLANDLGNLLSRTTAMIDKYCEGRVPLPPEPGAAGDACGELRAVAAAAQADYAAAMDALRLQEAAQQALRLVKRANKFIDERAPWELARDPARRPELESVLYGLAESLRISALLLTPMLVRAPGELFRQLGLAPEAAAQAVWSELAWGGLPPNTRINRGAPLFPRLDPKEVAPLVPVRPSPAPQ